MAKLFPSRQTVVDHIDGKKVILSTVKIMTTTSDHLELPNAVDCAFLHSNTATSDPTFYLTGGGASVAIDSGTVGTEYLIVSRHDGQVNFERGGNSRGNSNVN